MRLFFHLYPSRDIISSRELLRKKRSKGCGNTSQEGIELVERGLRLYRMSIDVLKLLILDFRDEELAIFLQNQHSHVERQEKGGREEQEKRAVRRLTN